MRLIVAVSFGLISALSSLEAANPPAYSETFLGSSAGWPPDGSGIVPYAISDLGLVAGHDSDYGGVPTPGGFGRYMFRPRVYLDGTVSPIAGLEWDVVWGEQTSVSNSGWIAASVGRSFVSRFYPNLGNWHQFAVCTNCMTGETHFLNGEPHAYIDDPGRTHTWDEAYQDGIRPKSVNSAGTVVGESNGGAFIWTVTGGLRIISARNGLRPVSAVRINDDGIVLGQNDQLGMAWDASGALLRQFPRGDVPSDINHYGRVVGTRQLIPDDSSEPTPQPLPFATSNLTSGTTLLPLLEGAVGGTAIRINDHGDIVGTCIFPDASNPGDYLRVATLWRAVEGPVRISELLQPHSEWKNSSPIDLNNAGEIVLRHTEPGNSSLFFTLLRPLGAIGVRFFRLQPESFPATNDIDAPLVPSTDLEKLRREVIELTNAESVGTRGMVADGVTPLVLQLRAEDSSSPGEVMISLETHGGLLRGTDSVEQHLRVRAGNSWKALTGISTKVVFDPLEENEEWLYLTPFDAESLAFEPGSNAISVTLKIERPHVRQKVMFQIRKPPVVLVHGYNAQGTTWGQSWDAMLGLSVSKEFIKRIDYGVSFTYVPLFYKADLSGNTRKSLRELASPLRVEVEAAREEWQKAWAVTRLDAVGHSQGGVLLRMLCGDSSAPSDCRFRNSGDSYRGLFRRVVTIGSPHAGSRFLHYLRTLRDKNPLVFTIIPMLADTFDKLVQEKFDPFVPNSQLAAISPVDPKARFHLVATTIDDGRAPGSPLSAKTPGVFLATLLAFNDRGAVVLPHGSDGIVDLDSQLALAPSGNNVTVLHAPDDPSVLLNISHAADDFGTLFVPELGDLSVFGVGSAQASQTQSVEVASYVARLLDGPDSKFGIFPKVVIDPEDAQKIEGAVPDLLPGESLLVEIGSAAAIVATCNMRLVSGMPLGAGPFWSAQRVTAHETARLNVSTSEGGLRATVSKPADSGDVYLYGSYGSSTGEIIASRPARLFAEGVGPGTEIRAVPSTVDLQSGQTAPVSFWRHSTNGYWLPVTVADGDNFTLTSSDPTTAIVDSGAGTVKLVKGGSATVTVTWNGLTTQIPIGARGPAARDGKVSVLPRKTVRLDLPSVDPSGREVQYRITSVPSMGWLSTPGKNWVFPDGTPYNAASLRYMHVPETNQLIFDKGPETYRSVYFTAKSDAEGEDWLDYEVVVDGQAYGAGRILLDLGNTAPTLIITSPTPGQRLTQETVTIKGVARDNRNVNEVQYRLNDGAWESANLAFKPGETPWTFVHGPREWSAGVTLDPGSNIVRFRARDSASNWSSIYTLRLTYVQTGLLQVAVSPPTAGSVKSGFLGSTKRELGATLTIDAKPTRGFIFEQWTGGVNSREAKLAFVMQPGLSLEAHFVPDPFPPLAGTYWGAVALPGSSLHGGTLRVQVSPGGIFSGSLILGATKVSVKGILDSAGRSTVTLKNQKLPVTQLELQIDTTNVTKSLTANLLDAASLPAATVTLDRAIHDGKRTICPETGSYTLVFRATDAIFPGRGCATCNVSASGIATLSGRLPDNTIILASAYVSSSGAAPFFARFKNGASILSTLHFDQGATTHEIDGDLSWRRVTGGTVSLSSFNALGSGYVRPAKAPDLLPAITGAMGGLLLAEDAQAVPLRSEPFVLATNGRGIFTAKAGAKLTVSFATGLFSGNFIHPSSGMSVKFYGAFVTGAGVAEGFYPSSLTSAAGAIRLTPNP